MTVWRAVGASVSGASHRKASRGCDDAHGWLVGDELSAIVVSDGAGSRTGTSALGAYLAVASVLDASALPGFAETVSTDPDEAVRTVFQEVISSLSAEADRLGLEAGALANTLSVGLLSGDTVAIGQIGDCIAVIEHQHETMEAVCIAEAGEYANQTYFVTAPDALDHLKIHSVTDGTVTSIALSTDGLKYKVLDDPKSGAPYEAFYRSSWDYARRENASSEALEAFLENVDDQTGDDKTLVLAVREFAGTQGDPRALTERPELVLPDSHDAPQAASGAVLGTSSAESTA